MTPEQIPRWRQRWTPYTNVHRRPVSIRFYEDNPRLRMVDPPVWLLTFNDPPADRSE